jgi:hypothetical protein
LTVELPISTPTNRFLTPQRDRRWPHVLSLVLMVSAVVLVALFLVGWPRLKSTSLHYDLTRLRAEVVELERRERALRLELESERNPATLAERAGRLGLTPPTPTDLEAAAAVEGAP